MTAECSCRKPERNTDLDTDQAYPTQMTTNMDPTATLRAASEGFDLLFSNHLAGALDVFADELHRDSPFHLMGLGVCAFLKAALGMEVCDTVCSATMLSYILR